MYTHVARMQKKELPTPKRKGIFYSTVVELNRSGQCCRLWTKKEATGPNWGKNEAFKNRI